MDSVLYMIDFVSWTACYAFIVYKSFHDRTYGMPLIPMAINIVWEIIRLKRNMWQINGFFYFLWVVLDFFIIVSFYKFAFNYSDKKEFKVGKKLTLSRKQLYIAATIYFIVVFIVIALIMKNIFGSSQVIAFVDNTLMSILFIRMLVKRKCLRGQSVFIGIFKFIGTLTAAIATYISLSDITYLIFGIVIGAIDITYIIMLLYYKKHTSFTVNKPRGIKL